MKLSDKMLITLTVSLALFMESVDTTIINTAIPAMARSLQVHPVDLKIALISYLLSLAIFIPISGWIADKFGIKRMFIVALSIFTLSSFWCGNVHTVLELVIARSVQGLGGALMLPLGRLIILKTHPRHEVVNAMNQVIMIMSIGLMLGPFMGGFITDRFSWHWIFWVNIPVGILAITMASIFLIDNFPRKSIPLDIIGFLLFGGGLAGIIFALADLSESNASHTVSLTIMAAACLLLIAYFVHSRKQPYPIVNVQLFRFRTFQVSTLGNMCARLGFGGVPFLLPLMLQIGLGYSAELSGLLLAPIAIGILLLKSLSLHILRMVGYKRLLIINTICVGLCLWGFQLIKTQTSPIAIGFLTFLFGFLISLQYSGMNSLGYADIPSDELSAASSIMSTIQQLAQSVGVAVSALLLRIFASQAGNSFMLTVTVFHQTFFALGILTWLSAFIFIRLEPADGQQMLKKVPEGT